MVEVLSEFLSEEVQMQHEVGLSQNHQNDRNDLYRQRMITVDTLAYDRETAGRYSCNCRIDSIKYRHAEDDISYRSKQDIGRIDR